VCVCVVPHADVNRGKKAVWTNKGDTSILLTLGRHMVECKTKNVVLNEPGVAGSRLKDKCLEEPVWLVLVSLGNQSGSGYSSHFTNYLQR
jgi:hypothetical protein